MNDEQIIEALATKVMGWQLTVDHRCWSLDGSDRNVVEFMSWNPLTSEAHAKMVREKLAERWVEWNLSLIATSSRTISGKLFEFSVTNGKHHESVGYEGHFADAETEEMAIALCALKTVGVTL